MIVAPLVATLVCFVAYWVAYRVYARYLAQRLFDLDGSRPTPAHVQRDDVDYVPANRCVLFGHHYASITGLSPMLGLATRLLRYNVSEVGETFGISALGNRCVASAVAVAAIWFFAFYQVGGEFAGLVLWQLFGATNQLMAGLALLAITVYLLRRGKAAYLHLRADRVHARLDGVGDGHQLAGVLGELSVDPVRHGGDDLRAGHLAHS